MNHPLADHHDASLRCASISVATEIGAFIDYLLACYGETPYREEGMPE